MGVVAAHTAHSCLSAYSTQCSRGVWGHAPPGKLSHMRVLRSGCQKSPQPRIVYGNWSVTKEIHQLVVSRIPFPSESAFVFEALPQNWSLLSLGSCRFECFMFARHKAVIHIEICTALE